MSTTTHTPSSPQVHEAHHPSQEDRRARSRPPARRWTGKLIGLLVAGALLSVVVYGGSRYLSTWTRPETSAHLTHTIARGDLVVTVTEDGNLESAKNVDIKCQVAGGSSILWIVDDGSTVKQGDKLVQLDSSTLEEQINQQKIAFEKARTLKIQAEKNLAVAQLAVKEYLEGTFKKSLQDADSAITIAQENLKSAQNSLEYSERMFRKGYVSSLELESQRFSVQRAQLELDSANTSRDVLVNFTKAKTLQDLESARDTADAQVRSENAAYALEEIRLKRLENQLAGTIITAPQDGMVVYANEPGRPGQQQTTIEEGSAVRERQTILRVPDLSQMQVKVNVHESKVENLGPGMRARIRILDRELTGSVTTVASQPEPTGFFSANVKEYATIVRVDGQPEGLRPGMTAEVEILVDHLHAVVTVPVAAIVQQQNGFRCWAQTPQGPQRRDLTVGQTNDQFVEIKEGLAEGEVVLLNPRNSVPEARVDEQADQQLDVTGRFGAATERGPAAGATGPGPGTAPPGPANGPAPPGAGPPPAGERPGPPADRGPGGGPGGGRRGDLMQMDRDGDGRVSREEAPEGMREFFDRLDGNGDGFIDREEAAALRRQFEGGGGPPGGPGGGPGGPPGA